MKLHWSPKSPYVRKVVMCAIELGLMPRIELVRNVAAMLKPNPQIMIDNPLSKIPTLVRDDGVALFDSVVICEYLDTLGNGSFFPANGPQKWEALRWHALGDGLLENLILWRNERERAVPLPALMAAFELKTRATLKLLENETRALSAASFSIGHVTIACGLAYLDFRFDALNWREYVPALSRWFESVESRRSFLDTVPMEDDAALEVLARHTQGPGEGGRLS
jgi:glutathione S-transferase